MKLLISVQMNSTKIAVVASKFMKINTNKNIKFIKDRPFNDIRYSVSFAK